MRLLAEVATSEVITADVAVRVFADPPFLELTAEAVSPLPTKAVLSGTQQDVQRSLVLRL
jgi:hypothetical protein